MEKKRVRTAVVNMATLSLPLLTLGMIGTRLALWIAVAIIAVAVVLLGMLSVCSDKCKPSRIALFAKLLNDSAAPYAILLSSLIMKNIGMDATAGLWFSILTWIIIIFIDTAASFRAK